MNICINTVHLFLYECITCKVKSCLSYISYFLCYHKYTQIQNNRQENKIVIGEHPVPLVGQAKDFHQHHIWCFPLLLDLLECRTHPLQWSAVMSSHAAFMASNRDIWSCGLWSYTFHLHAEKNSSIWYRNEEYGGRNSTVILSCAANQSLKMLVR